jgi:putative membrane protein
MAGNSNHSLLNLLLRWVVLAVGVVLAAHVVPGISYANDRTLILVVLLLSFCNAVLRPILLLFTLPFIIVSLGFGVLLVNALLFYFVGKILSPDFLVTSFWSALGGSLIVSVTNLAMNAVLRTSRQAVPPARQPPPAKHDDVIDI